jgi:hypothetical protein
MSGSKVTFTGFESFIKNLNRLSRAYPDGVAVALMEEGYALDAVMVPRIPFRTGRTMNSHFVAPPSDDFRPAVVVGVGTWYAPYLERAPPGTRFARGERRFLGKSLEERMRGYTERLAIRTKAAAMAGRKVGSSVDPGRAPTRPNANEAPDA